MEIFELFNKDLRGLIVSYLKTEDYLNLVYHIDRQCLLDLTRPTHIDFNTLLWIAVVENDLNLCNVSLMNGGECWSLMARQKKEYLYGGKIPDIDIVIKSIQNHQDEMEIMILCYGHRIMDLTHSQLLLNAAIHNGNVDLIEIVLTYILDFIRLLRYGCRLPDIKKDKSVRVGMYVSDNRHEIEVLWRKLGEY